MKKERPLFALIMFALSSWTTEAFAEPLDVTLRIRARDSDEKTITRPNLIAIKQFILAHGKRETYSNRFSNNPAYPTARFRFYLDPDTGQKNADCDPTKSDFHTLTIRRSTGGRNQYRAIEFLGKYDIYIHSTYPSEDLTVQQLRGFVEDAMKEILEEIGNIAQPSK